MNDRARVNAARAALSDPHTLARGDSGRFRVALLVGPQQRRSAVSLMRIRVRPVVQRFDVYIARPH